MVMYWESRFSLYVLKSRLLFQTGMMIQKKFAFLDQYIFDLLDAFVYNVNFSIGELRKASLVIGVLGRVRY